MSQPAPGSSHSPSARLDPEAELLLAMGRRDAALCRPLAQQLVHRRGVSALATLRRRSLALEPDQQGWNWLSELLHGDPMSPASVSPASNAVMTSPPAPAMPGDHVVPLPAPLASPQGPAAAGSSQEEEDRLAVPAHGQQPSVRSGSPGARIEPGESSVALASSPILESTPALVAIPAVAPKPAEVLAVVSAQAPVPEQTPQLESAQALRKRPALVDLDHRAEAAVDAAFEALAAEFAADGAKPFAEPAALAPDVAAAPPVTFAAGAAEPAALLFPALQLKSSLAHSVESRFSFVIPQPPQAELPGSEPTGSDRADQSMGFLRQQGADSQADDPLPASAAGSEAGGSMQTAGFWNKAEDRIAGLRDRVRSHLSLSRVRSGVRDGVEAALSSLQGLMAGTELQRQGARAHSEQFEEPAAASEPLGSEPLGFETEASAAASWSLEQRLQLRPVAPALSGYQAPVAAFGPPLAGDPGPAMSEANPPPARLSAAQQLRQTLLGRYQGETRPAPAPQALSDLRAWLPADDDLPRAS